MKVVNMPWLNRVDVKWLAEVVGDCPAIYVLDDHAKVGGLADMLLNTAKAQRLFDTVSFHTFAVEGHPACGTPAEVLHFHGLDAVSLAQRVLHNQSRS
jgi:transketolase